MKFSNQFTPTRFASPLTIALLAGACAVLPTHLQAADLGDAQAKPATAQRRFATPDDAMKALQTAAQARDQAAMAEIFGPESRELLTGDKVQDDNNAKRFATAMTEGCTTVKDSEDKITIEVGANNWPMPIPLVKADGQWRFDTAAGKEEIINRHIGKDELHAISVCRAYVTAQRQFSDMNGKAGIGATYAMKFKSSPGMKDGLYWPVAANEPASPFGPLVAEAHAEGYGANGSTGLHAFHGYYFRILTRQGPSAFGGKLNYISNNALTDGFALVAYPEVWDKSGIVTFIVNQEGKVYQKNLGEKTSEIAGAMKEFNPDSEWTPVTDAGALNVVSEQ
jgi:hypothetical protein